VSDLYEFVAYRLSWLGGLVIGVCALGAALAIISVAKAPDVSSQRVAADSQIIFEEAFEGGLGEGWRAIDAASDLDGGEYAWGTTGDFVSSSPSHSAWCVGGGQYGDDLIAGTDGYPNTVDSWLIYGPIDLTDALDGYFRFNWWLDTPEPVTGDNESASLRAFDGDSGTPEGGDWFGWCILTEEDDLDGTRCTYMSGSTGTWVRGAVPLADYLPNNGDGAGEIWIAFRFVSDDDPNNGRGAFVDDVTVEIRRHNRAFLPLVRRDPTPTPTPTPTPSPTPESPPVQDNLLENPGFEGGTTRETTYWTADGGPYHTEFGEITTPSGWVTWWREGFPCSGTADYNAGRPEVKVIDASFFGDPERWRSGQKATLLFTFWRCHEMGLYQEVPVEVGRQYALQAYGHAWYSQCSDAPHSPPLEADCETPLTWAHDTLRVGVDPDGGVDYDEVVWSGPVEIYGRYGDPVRLEGVTARGPTVTVWLYARATHPLKHNDVYWDDVTLEVTP